jgi:hypothetical protein
MDFGEFIPIAGIVASAWVVVTYLHYRFRRGSPGSEIEGAMTVDGARENAQLARENETLKLTIHRLEERMAVLERIATDPAERTAREIEQLR